MKKTFQEFLISFNSIVEGSKNKVFSSQEFESFNNKVQGQMDNAESLYKTELKSLLSHNKILETLGLMSELIEKQISNISSYEIVPEQNIIKIEFKTGTGQFRLVDLKIAADRYFKLNNGDITYYFLLSYLSAHERYDIIQIYHALSLNYNKNVH